MKENSIYLTNTIFLDAILTTSMKAVKLKLSSYPSLSLVSEGSNLKYLINNEGTPDRFYTIELRPNAIIMTLNSSTSPLYFLREELLRLITFIMILPGEYKTELDQLLPYVVSLLTKERNLDQTPCPQTPGRDTDLILSRRIIELLKTNMKSAEELKHSNAMLISVLSNFILSRYSYNFNEERVVKELGISAELVRSVIRDLRENGYKILTNNNGTINLVRI